MYHGKPIIGLAGGIGSGKSTVARMFGEIGCLVIDADEQVSQAYRDPEIVRKLHTGWGDEIFLADGQVNRRRLGELVFSDTVQRRRLEGLLHPKVALLRDRVMSERGDDPQVIAFIWDAPLLFEVGLVVRCDATVFVEAPLSLRLQRVRRARGWEEDELRRRENLQWPLDKKREISDYVIDNTADADNVRGQVSEVLFRILARRLPEQA